MPGDPIVAGMLIVGALGVIRLVARRSEKDDPQPDADDDEV